MENNNSNSTSQDPIDLPSLHWKLKSKATATGSSSSPSSSSTAKELKPSHLNILNSSGLFQLVSTDKMSVQYVGAQHHGHDVGAAQADCPAPTKKTAYYFEMTVRNAGDKGQVAIGFTGRNYNLSRQPGCRAGLSGIKMARRIGSIEEFEFKPIGENHNQSVVPMENLNGHKLVEAGDLCERRNGRGVDLNKNWSVDWGQKGDDRFFSSIFVFIFK